MLLHLDAGGGMVGLVPSMLLNTMATTNAEAELAKRNIFNGNHAASAPYHQISN